MAQSIIEIKTAVAAEDFSLASELILEYANWLGLDLSFQNFDTEMAALPKMYNANDGGLFIAYIDGNPAGVAGLRRFNETDSEVKRMFVKPESRGFGIGKLLLSKCIDVAKALQYRSIKLDTADFMKTAIELYMAHGFHEIAAYRYNPYESARYFELQL